MEKRKIIYIPSLIICKNMPFECAKFEMEKPRKFEYEKVQMRFG